MRNKHELMADVISNIDDDVLDKHLIQRAALWAKRGKRSKKPLYSAIAIAACLCILATTLFIFIDRNPVMDPNIPVYQGMTVENSAPSKVASLPSIVPLGAITNSMNASAAPLTAPQSAAPSFEILPLDGSEKDKDKENGKDKTPPVFAETYYAMPGEDIYIHIHISNPAGYEILSFTLNGVKYSSYMFEPGSDLETLILKQNVGMEGGLKEYTIDAIKYVDGEKIKDVRMEGNKTVKVHVNDNSAPLQLKAEIDGLTLNIRSVWADGYIGEKKIVSLAIYENDVLYKELATDAVSVNGLPLGKRLVLKAVYLEDGKEKTVNHVFSMPRESEGIVISNGVITSIGTCSDTVLYLNHPIAEKFLHNNLNVQKVYMTENVTSIGQMAFFGCKNLEEAVLPDHLIEIPDSLFGDCFNLSSVSLPAKLTRIGNGAFSGCRKLGSIHLPEGLVSIGGFAFDSCSFTSIVLPRNVTSIGDFAFQSCTALTSITIPASMTHIGNYAFTGCVKLFEVINHSDLLIKAGAHSDSFIGNNAIEVHSGATKIVNRDGYLFYPYNGENYLIGYTGSQTDLILPQNYNGEKYKIHNYAFHECSELTSIAIPEGVTSIGEYAFYGCSKLTNVTIPDSVTSMGDFAFQFCTSLTSVTIPNSVTSMGGGAFSHCRSLTNITIPDSVTSILYQTFEDCSGLTSIVIPDSITWIESYAFLHCTSLTSVTIPNSITVIPSYAFSGCSSLASIEIPDSVTSIHNNAFENCSSLTIIAIPKSVTDIGEDVFTNCDSLTSIYCVAQSKPSGWSVVWNRGCTAQIVFGVAPGCEHVWTEATCQNPKTCTVCGIQDGSKKPHEPNENSVCTMCGYTLTEIDLILQNIMETAPKASIYFRNPIVEIWNNNLQLLIDGPYNGTTNGNGTPSEVLQFEFYYTPKGNSDYTLITLRSWSFYSFGSHAIYRFHFYDLLYPGLTVDTEYDVTIVMKQGNAITCWANTTLSWSETMEETVQQALSDPSITK